MVQTLGTYGWASFVTNPFIFGFIAKRNIFHLITTWNSWFINSVISISFRLILHFWWALSVFLSWMTIIFCKTDWHCSSSTVHIVLSHQLLLLTSLLTFITHILTVELPEICKFIFSYFHRNPILATCIQVAIQLHFSQHLLIL